MSILAERHAKTLLGVTLVVGASGLLYFFTAARDIVVGDSPELITAAATLGVAHEPGYPLFTMLGHLFSMLPFGSIPFRVNLLSVACDALTVGVIYLTTIRLTRSHLAGALAALLLAVNPVFWSWSVEAEVFPLNNLLAALLILSLAIWHEQPDRPRFLVAAFFFAGLGLTNHQTIVLLAPAFCLVLWQRHDCLSKRAGLWGLCVGAFLAGLLPYVYVPWASAHHPVYNWGNVSSIADFIAVVTRKSYGTGHLVSALDYTGGSPVARIAALVASLGLTSLTFIFIGAAAAYRSARWYFWFSLAAFVFTGPFFVWITNLNLATAPSGLFVLQRFFLLPHVILAPLVGFGILWIGQLLKQNAPKLGIYSLRLVAAAVLLAISIVVLTQYRRIDQSRNSIERRFAEDVFATIEPHSILLARGDVAFALMYFQKVEHIGTETELVLLPLLGTAWYVNQIREEHSDLIIPFDQYDLATNNLRKFVDANSDRRICIAGTIGSEDRSLSDSYWPYQRGLLLMIEPKSKNIPLQEMMNENERLLDRYRPPEYQAVRTNTFEADILNIYAWPAFRIGNDCALVGLNEQARKWFGRALEINPNFGQARDALARLGP